MSDYAGPILGAVGAVVGFVATGYNPQGAYWGWAIGSALGGAYSASQQVIPGPKIGDVQRQTSQEGGFRPIVYGRSTPISGNVIADSEPKIVKKKEDAPGGKGGPKVETEYAYRTYAVGFCEGEAGLLQAWRNGILVYDAEDPSMAAENAKFLEYATWYTGTFGQMPDPDLEAIYGVGNTPFFRGTSYLVLASEDVTDQRGAWSQWQVRVFRGSNARLTTPPYVLEGVEQFGTNANVASIDVRSTANITAEFSGHAEITEIELRLMRQVQSNFTAEFVSGAEVTDIEVREMRIVESNLSAEFASDATVSDIELIQQRVVLDDIQETKYTANASVTSIEVIIP